MFVSAPATSRWPDGPVRPRVSVCIATFNGGDYVLDQLRSVLTELADGDEVVIWDDGSTDGTPLIIETLGDHRIRIHQAPNRGHVRAFESALHAAAGDIIFLADQDDVWVPGRVAAMLDALASAPMVATTFALMHDRSVPLAGRLPEGPRTTCRRLGNVVGILTGTRPYWGCTMAFHGSLREVALPFPRETESHDVWLAIVGNAVGGVAHVEDPSVLRRVHGANLTGGRRGWVPIVHTRIGYLILIIRLAGRLARYRLTPVPHGLRR